MPTTIVAIRPPANVRRAQLWPACQRHHIIKVGLRAKLNLLLARPRGLSILDEAMLAAVSLAAEAGHWNATD